MTGRGSAVGAILADAFSVEVTIWAVAGLTAFSGLVVAVRMYETRSAPSRGGAK